MTTLSLSPYSWGGWGWERGYVEWTGWCGGWPRFRRAVSYYPRPRRPPSDHACAPHSRLLRPTCAAHHTCPARPARPPTFSAQSMRGATSLQGPHQVAQKSTSTGLSLCCIVGQSGVGGDGGRGGGRTPMTSRPHACGRRCWRLDCASAQRRSCAAGQARAGRRRDCRGEGRRGGSAAHTVGEQRSIGARRRALHRTPHWRAELPTLPQ